MALQRLKSSQELDAMRDSGRMLAKVLNHLKKNTEQGMTPKDLALIARKELSSLGGEPAFLGYQGFPDVICISVNDQVQHSIPDTRPLKNGDVINFDFGVRYKGMITDSGVTIIVGDKPNSNRDAELLKGTKEALDAAISIVRSGVRVGEVSNTIQNVLDKYRLGIVKELVGHGVGHELHEDPEIPNYGNPNSGPLLSAGMTIAIEPITTTGSPDIYIEKDGWTIRTWDGSNSAQFEHTLLVLDNGAEIITQE